MDESDYIAIEDSLAKFATALGAPEIMEDRHYRTQESIESTGFLMRPRQRVVAKIEAIDRLLSLRDRTTYERAMHKIRGLLREASREERTDLPERAVIALESRGDDRTSQVDLGDLPDLSEARERLRNLRDQLSEG